MKNKPATDKRYKAACCVLRRRLAAKRFFGSSPYEIRTRITTVKGWCPNP